MTGNSSRSILGPALLGVALTGATGVCLYLLLRKDDEEEDYAQVSKGKTSRQVALDVRIPKESVGIVIGLGGSNIRSMTSKQPSEMNLEQLKISDAKEDPKHFHKKIGNELMLNIPDAMGREPGKVNPTGRGDGKKSEETEDRGEKEKGKPPGNDQVTETYDEPNWEKEKNASQRDVNDNEHDGPKEKIDEVSLTWSKDLGKYCERTEFTNEKGRPQEKGRVLGAGEVDIIRICAGCGKRMSKVKAPFVCTCKLAIHCSRDCFKSSNHNCKEPFVENIPGTKTNPEDNDLASHELRHFVKFNEAVDACYDRFLANKGTSFDKVTSLVKTTRGDHRRILNYAERANHHVAAYVVGRAYMERDFDRRAVYAIPVLYKEKSVTETNEIAVRWLKVAAEAEIPEAMFCLFLVLKSMGDLKVDPRVPEYWLARAHATGEMDYLIQILQTPYGNNFPAELEFLYNLINENCDVLRVQNLASLLLATRFRELKAWSGKTALGEPFYGFPFFKSIMESIGELKNDQARSSVIDGKKKTVVISGRPGFSEFIVKRKREENNLKFQQGVKQKISLDYQLLGQTSNVDGITSYLVTCKHDEVSMEEGAKHIEYKNGGVIKTLDQGLIDRIKKHKTAGKCESCVLEAKQRLRAVSLGQFNVSLTPLLFGQHYYVARYANDNEVIVQDVFFEYSKPYMRQVLQCLMSNPPDLHPLAVAENAYLFWPVIWFWGSVYGAVEDTCNIITLHAIYGSLSDKSAFAKSENASALAAFPETAAGEWRIACGNEDCPKVDHEVKFNLCAGCKVGRYCGETCQKKDWAKHMTFCKANRKGKK